MTKITTPEVQPFETRHASLLRALAPQCMVLLKTSGAFPLDGPCPIAVYGAGARHTVKGGTGSGDVNVRSYLTIEQALTAAGFSVTTAAWLDAYQHARTEARAGFFAQIRAEAEQAGLPAFMLGMGRVPPEPSVDLPLSGTGDVCLYVLARNFGEGADRSRGPGDFSLSKEEIRDIRACAASYKKMMLVLNVGGPVDLSPVLEDVPDILLLSQLGSVTGESLADVLLGKVSPSGRLASTWPRAEDLTEDFGDPDVTRYREGVFVGYRYFEASGKAPLFPFGFGLSWTEFSVQTDSFTAPDAVITVAVRVKNTGAVPCGRALGLWYSAPRKNAPRPRRELGAYAATGILAPGQEKTLSLRLPAEDMARWDEGECAWVLDGGDYVLSLDGDPAGMITVPETRVTLRQLSLDGGADFVDFAPALEDPPLPEGLPRLTLTDIPNGHHDRMCPASPAESAERAHFPSLFALSDEQLSTICVGKFRAGADISVIGSAAFQVAGAAGETADLVQSEGFGRLILADGPAGVRVSQRCVDGSDGAYSLDGGPFADMYELLTADERETMDNAAAYAASLAGENTPYYQYATAIPIGTALTQSWDTAVAEACGRVIGEEMALFGVNVWLAPAMNIHRSPLCGRTFEYYSEDPLLTGLTAGAVTRGVQGGGKRAVTVKHFCCNNQETNRFGSDSLVSQRALREIYLRGFELCVKTAHPLCVMTSYNLLGGRHTANRRDLLEDVLRMEWGFDGVVMTDWGTTAIPSVTGRTAPSTAHGCIEAGNDLVMPGGQNDVDDIVAAVRAGELSRERLELCAGRILALARHLVFREQESGVRS